MAHNYYGFERDEMPRTYAQALAEGEFSRRWEARQEEEARLQQEAQERAAKAREWAARAAKVEKKHPWLADVAQAPRRRRNFN